MKYTSPKANSNIGSYPEPSPKLSTGYSIIPKGLSKKAYEIIREIKMYGYCDLCIKNMTKEELYNLSKEVSDFNLGKIEFPELNLQYGISIKPIQEIEDYALETRWLKYPLKYKESELCEDISNMAKEGYKLTAFWGIYVDNCFVAAFTKGNNL